MVIELIDKLNNNKRLTNEEYLYILENIDNTSKAYLKKISREVTDTSYGSDVYLRGLIEISNYCSRSCNYCGIRVENDHINRYRLSKEDILGCCKKGYELGYKTFVLQGGEDSYFTRDVLSDIISEIKNNYSDVALTLSIGERSYDDYEAFFNAGADRFLLRHETASKELYEYLHPKSMSYDNRMRCIRDLKKIGYQVGVGMMIGSPTQTNQDLANDLEFIQSIQPAMCGIGPYINHTDTPFKDYKSESSDLTLVMLGLVRIMLPNCLLPATTALATINNEMRLEALSIGANIVMPNLTPTDARKSYEIYQGKKITGCESAEEKDRIIKEIESIGLNVKLVRGDTKMEGY